MTYREYQSVFTSILRRVYVDIVSRVEYILLPVFMFQLKLEKDCEKMRAEKDKFHDFINRMDSWLVSHCRELRRYFMQFDEEGEGILTYDDFKSGKSLCKCYVLFLTSDLQ